MALPDVPITRVEQYLSRATGQNTDIPEYPITRVEQYLEHISKNTQNMLRNQVESLDNTVLSYGEIEAVGIPAYVSDVSMYSNYNLTKTGWYVFGRVYSKYGERVSAGTTVTGVAGYVAQIGADYVDVAVQFEVASTSKTVVINWGESTDTLVFKATDLAVRNLDYRVTFYVYDIDEFTTWEFAQTDAAAFEDGKYYFVKHGGEYVSTLPTVGDPIPAYYEPLPLYMLTEDETFVSGKTYYTKEGNVYTAAEVTAGEAVPENTYCVFMGSYALTTDTEFVEGTTYYTKAGTVYTPAEVTPGEAVTANTYYVQIPSYAFTTDEIFVSGKTYYIKESNVYTEATVTVGDPVPAYYVHSKVIFQGMTKNVTYRCDTVIDCPSEFILPEVEDDDHGAWFEIRFRHSGSFSSTLTPPCSDVRIATEHTQAETAGMNMVNLHYSHVAGQKVWRFMNTHSNFTPTSPALESIAFRTPPTTLEYTAGDTLDLTGAVVVATFEDGSSKIVTSSCTFTPASGAELAVTDTELTASYTTGDVTKTVTVALTVQEGE